MAVTCHVINILYKYRTNLFLLKGYKSWFYPLFRRLYIRRVSGVSHAIIASILHATLASYYRGTGVSKFAKIDFNS